MGIDGGAMIDLENEAHEPVAQWQLRDHGPLDMAVRIQVGTVAGGWYVRHQGFGGRRFGDKTAAWQAVRGLMGQHDGRWERVEVDSAPFRVVCRPDGSRVLYDTHDDESLHAGWGRHKDERWAAYMAAMDAGETLRRTETHSLLEGAIELIRYRDPVEAAVRYAVSTAVEAGSDWRVVDHRERGPADAEYEHEVHANADPELPYRSSDMTDVPVSRRSRPPDGLSVLPSGEVGVTEDLRHLGLLPPRIIWPRTPAPAGPPRPVCGMTARPRDWGPKAVNVQDVTPVAWQEAVDPPPNHLALASLPDGRHLLASADDAVAEVWSTGDGRRIRTVSGHAEWVLSVALTVLPDGKVVLATGGKDGLARVWTTREGEPVAELTGHRGPVNALAWASPPGDVPWLVTGGDDATVRVWDVESERIRAAFEVGDRGVDLVWSVAAAVRSDGHVCVVAGVDDAARSTVYVWDATAGTTTHEFVFERAESGIRSPQVAVATLADRSLRVAAAAGGVVRVWDGHTGEVVRTFTVPGRGDGGVALAVLPDLRVAVAATGGRQTVVWDAESGAPLATVDHAGEGWRKPVALVARPDGALLLATGREGDTPARVLRVSPHW
ncbi:WD40 repeat domain-containing protein [Dactylosporangium aurantiacum]|uniref:WD40 repeat domain-containing protein n=2 Tax=Dactylosporangium aurantiacum TaxID=35754 RepID=A0A9Q9MMT5_9ACTN|nr:WD40 repeat domain-containing protein [Dactylosporangium aurantiacum]UWZ58526.1 WD40 repeat domain-containing protein [Dactylosporangium aurantiacum]